MLRQISWAVARLHVAAGGLRAPVESDQLPVENQAGRARHGDHLRGHVALILQPFHASNGPAPLGVELQESIEIDFRAPILQRGAVLVSMIAKVFARQHGARL